MCNQCNLPTIDEAKSNEFAAKMLGILNNGALGMMISLGHRTRLFDTMSTIPAATASEIASTANLNERYVREWLGAMVTGGIVEYQADSNTFTLPSEHAAFLTRDAGPNNMAVPAQFLSVLGAVEDEVEKCFREGGGVPYANYPRFQEVMAEESNHSVVESLETNILPLADGLVARLEDGIKVLDVGCGRGRAMLRLARRFPKSHFVGLDLSEETVEFANAMAAEQGLTNVEFVAKDVSDFDRSSDENAFDLVTTFDAIHDQGKPLNVLKGIRRTLKPDGLYLMQEISGTSKIEEDKDHPLGPLLYTISCMHCMTVSLASGGEGLGAMWGEETTREYLMNAGFNSIVTNKFEHDVMNNWYVVQNQNAA